MSFDEIKVLGASGSSFDVFTEEEQEWFYHNLDRYQSQYNFDNVSDFQDLDRLLSMELLSYRFSKWLLSGVDYEDKAFDDKAIRDYKEKVDREIRLLKKSMGMDRKGRQESESADVADYLTNLLERAKEFGVHRDTQIAKAIDLINDLKSLVGRHDRMDQEERDELKLHESDILDWIRETLIPEYDAVDAAFRKNQKLWIGEV